MGQIIDFPELLRPLPAGHKGYSRASLVHEPRFGWDDLSWFIGHEILKEPPWKDIALRTLENGVVLEVLRRWN